MLMRENEQILNEIKRRKREMKEKEIEKEIENERKKKEIEIEKECKQEMQIEKESETQEKKENMKEASVIEFSKKETEVKEKEFENELEKEMNEKDEREQEKVRNVFTNQLVSFPHIVSSFQVSKDYFDKFQLHYPPEERRFKLFSKGNIIDDFSPQLLKGKQGKGSLAFDFQQSHLNVIDKVAEDLALERAPHHDLSKCHSLIADEFILKYGMKSSSTNKYVVGKFDDEARLNWHEQNLDLCDKKMVSNLFVYYDHVNSLICYAKSTCLSKSVD
ncbi:hypothetical protein PVK06_030479 [Gossypium arboreum]|uniref:Uncharacterized protein n=1 Tax=Gossypium arboreum TaxID=29729 RepID=A0ABR0NRL8_GOSAR|nr:hypothetical protein PVK06_030479 [Gossypium arboreum]